jgi:hypothetical protein
LGELVYCSANAASNCRQFRTAVAQHFQFRQATFTQGARERALLHQWQQALARKCRRLDAHRLDLGEEDVVIASPLVLLETDQLDFYRTRGRALRSSR